VLWILLEAGRLSADELGHLWRGMMCRQAWGRKAIWGAQTDYSVNDTVGKLGEAGSRILVRRLVPGYECVN
jgi:hypothetical protein